jgi:hypothetical protein
MVSDGGYRPCGSASMAGVRGAVPAWRCAAAPAVSSWRSIWAGGPSTAARWRADQPITVPAELREVMPSDPGALGVVHAHRGRAAPARCAAHDRDLLPDVPGLVARAARYEIDDVVRAAAAAYPNPALRSLDAIHLAAARARVRGATQRIRHLRPAPTRGRPTPGTSCREPGAITVVEEQVDQSGGRQIVSV